MPKVATEGDVKNQLHILEVVRMTVVFQVEIEVRLSPQLWVGSLADYISWLVTRMPNPN